MFFIKFNHVCLADMGWFIDKPFMAVFPCQTCRKKAQISILQHGCPYFSIQASIEFLVVDAVNINVFYVS
jgi:hypothetical protein